MNYKKSMAMLSLVAVPAAITAIPAGNVQAAPQDEAVQFSGSWVNPHFIYEGNTVIEKVAAVNAVAAVTPIEATSYEELKKAIYKNLSLYNTEFSIKYLGDTSNLSADISKIYTEIHKDALMIYESGTIAKMEMQGSYVNSQLQLNFTQKYHTTATQEQIVTERVKEIKQQIISASMTDFEKIKAINDYVVLNTTYSTDTDASAHAAYAILAEGKGVCQAYALLAYRLFKEAGIEAKYVTGYAGGDAHAWNLVELDNKWYHIDTTWNDPVFSESDGEKKDYVHYEYFLLSDEDIKKDHIIDDNGYPAATDNTYRPLHNVKTPVQVNDVLYFPNANDDIQLYKINLKNIVAGVEKVSSTRVQHLVAVDDWLYFSNYSNGAYLSKMKLDGTEQSIVKNVAITSLKLDGNDLVYTTTDNKVERMQVIDPEEENKAAAKAVSDLIAVIDDTAVNFIELVANARTAYDKLTTAQQGYVTNVAMLQQAEIKVAQENAAVNDVIQQIAQLNELDEQFHANVINARVAYDKLSADLKLRITNEPALKAAEVKVEADKNKAAAVEALINALDPTNGAYFKATTEARNAYDLLITPQRNLISDAVLQKLVDVEQKKKADEDAVFNVNYTLDLLNETAVNFKTIVPELRAKYDALTTVQKTLVLKLSDLEKAESTYAKYEQMAKELEQEITALNEAAPTFYVDVQKVNDAYNALHVAQQAFVSDTAKSKLQKMVDVASVNLNAAQTVINQIAIIQVTNTSFIAEVAEAHAAYAALTAIQKELVKNYSHLTNAQVTVDAIEAAMVKIEAIPAVAENFVTNYDAAKTAYVALSVDAQKHVTNGVKLDKASAIVDAATNVEQKIAALTTDSSATDIAEVRTAYNALAPLAKELVTKQADLEAAELGIKQKDDQVKANTVIGQIHALKPVAEDFIAKYEAAKVAYEGLTADQKAYVTNDADLLLAASAVEAVQEVIDAIDAVAEAATYKANAHNAQTKYNELDPALTVAVTNKSTLTAIATNVTAAEKVEQAIQALTNSSSLEEIDQAKADYAALTALQKQLVPNDVALTNLENEVKAAMVETLISNLVETDENQFIADVTKAQTAYEALTAEQKDLVPNTAKLEEAVARVADIVKSNGEIASVIQLIAKINDTAATFSSAVADAEQAYNALAPEQQAKVTNAADIANHKETMSKLKEIAADFESQVTSVDTASLTFIADVEAAQNRFFTFGAAQVTFIAADVKALLAQYVADIATIRAVEAKLLLLNTLSTNYYAEVAQAEVAYASLSSDYQAFLSEEAVAKLEEAKANVATDQAVAQNVEAAIAALTTASGEVAVQTARAQYNALTANQKQLVPNVAKLVEVEAALANAGSNSGAADGETTGGETTGGGSSSGGGSGSTGGSSSSGSGSSSSGSSSGGSSSGGSSSSGGGNSSAGSNSSTSGSNSPANTPASGNEQSTTVTPTVQVGDNGTSYSVVVPPVTTKGNAQPVTITVSENVRITVPATAIPTAANTASIAMAVDVSEDNVIQFKATIEDAPVKFATYIEFEVANLPDGAVILRRDENGNLSAVPFTVEDGKHVIKTRTSGEFVVSTVNVTFGDVAKDGHKEYIDALAKRHIVTGVDAESFEPNAGMTRAQFSAMIARAMNLEASNETSFADVKGKWYESSVQALAEAGIVNGKSDDMFDPGQTITRQQTSVMVERLLKYAGVELPQADLENVPFTDFDKVPASYQSSVALMYQLGIFTGKADGSFDASGELTRSQMTKVLYKALQLAGML